MMEMIKGLARRTTQSVRERVRGREATQPDPQVVEAAAKVRVMEEKSDALCEKLLRVARLMGELGTALKEIGDDYAAVPDLATESRRLAADMQTVGTKLTETTQEHQRGLKDNGFDLLRQFGRECKKLREVEDTWRHHQLEYDFFKAKVIELRSTPQKDFTRLPRNEHILEGWRTELWRATEVYKERLSALHLQGRRSIDCSVLTAVQVLNSFVDIASTGFKQTFHDAQLPVYSTDPVLPPAPLPPNPMPPAGPPLIAGTQAHFGSNGVNGVNGVNGIANGGGGATSAPIFHPQQQQSQWGPQNGVAGSASPYAAQIPASPPLPPSSLSYQTPPGTAETPALYQPPVTQQWPDTTQQQPTVYQPPPA